MTQRKTETALFQASTATRKLNPALFTVEVSSTDLVQEKKNSQARTLKENFLGCWKAFGGPDLEEEFKFHPERKWRFDFVHHQSRVAVEVDGGVFMNGGHCRGAQITKDYEKRNAATAAGWHVFQLTSVNIREGEDVRLIVLFVMSKIAEAANEDIKNARRADDAGRS